MGPCFEGTSGAHRRRWWPVCIAAATLSAGGAFVANVGCSSDRFSASGGDAGGDGGTADAGGDDGAAQGDASPVCPPTVDLRTDPKNCGRCAHDCLGGQCLDTVCGPVLVQSEPEIESVAFDTGSIYFTRYSGTGGGVFRVDKAAAPRSPATTLVPQAGAWAVTTRGGDLVWTNWGGAEAAGTGGIYRFTLATSQLHPRVAFGSPRGILSDGAGVFFIDNFETAVSFLDDSGGFVPLAGAIAQAQAIATDSHFVYFSDYKDTALHAVWKAGKVAPIVSRSAVGRVGSLAVYANYLYLTLHGDPGGGDGGAPPACDATPGSVMRGPLQADGTLGALELVADGQPCARGLTVDATGIYWSAWLPQGQGAVRRVTSPGGPVEHLVEGLTRPFLTARDEGAVYWITDDGDLGRIALP